MSDDASHYDSNHSSACTSRVSAADHRRLRYQSTIGLTPEGHPMRYRFEKMFYSDVTELVISLAIMLNLILLIAETDTHKVDGQSHIWLICANKAMLLFFTVEALARIFTFRLFIFQDRWALFDLFIIFSDILFTILELFLSNMPSVMMMRIVRLLRVFRSTEVTRYIPQLNIIVLSLAGAAAPLFWGGVMLILLLAASGILAVQLINPVIEDMVSHGGFAGCDRCKRSFATVWQSSLTIIQQVITGDSWGTVCLPVIEHSPWTLIFFGCVFIIFSMALLNIIMANIVDAVMQARVENDHFMADVKKRERVNAKHVIFSYCKAIDADNSGNISHEEFKRGYQNEAGFRDALNAMDLRSDDLDAVWSILDQDESGDVSYSEFCEQLYKMKYSDAHTLMVIVKAQVADIRKTLRAEVKLMSDDIAVTLHENARATAAHSNQLSQILTKIDALSNTKPIALDPSIPGMRSQEKHGSGPALVRPEIRQQASQDEQDLALNQLLQSQSKLEKKFETVATALRGLISAESSTWELEIQRFHEASSKSKGGAHPRNGESEQVPRSDFHPPFGMCCKGIPASSNFATIIKEPLQTYGDHRNGPNLLVTPDGLGARETPQHGLTRADMLASLVSSDGDASASMA